MILGKTCKKKITGKVGRKIKYAKEGDEALGFLSESLSKGKLVVGSTYYCGDNKRDIPYNSNGCDCVGFDPYFRIPAIHVVCFESVDWKNKQITTIDSICGKSIISFADFKKYFSDIHVTDFSKEAEILKKQEKLEKEVNEVIDTLNKREENITDLKLTELDESLQKTNNELKSFQNKIEQGQDDLNKGQKTFCDETKNKFKNLDRDISEFQNTIRENLEKLGSVHIKEI